LSWLPIGLLLLHEYHVTDDLMTLQPKLIEHAIGHQLSAVHLPQQIG